MDISVSNDQYIIDNVLITDNKYGLGRLEFVVDTGTCDNNIFWQVEQIHNVDMHHQAHGYFGLRVIRNFGNQVLPKPLVVQALLNLSNTPQEVQNFYGSVRSGMIAKEI